MLGAWRPMRPGPSVLPRVAVPRPGLLRQTCAAGRGRESASGRGRDGSGGDGGRGGARPGRSSRTGGRSSAGGRGRSPGEGADRGASATAGRGGGSVPGTSGGRGGSAGPGRSGGRGGGRGGARGTGRGTGRGAAPPDARLLTTWIREAGNLSELRDLVAEHGEHMNAIHLPAALSRLGRLPGLRPAAKQPLAQELMARIQGQLDGLQTRNLANTVYCMHQVAVAQPDMLDGCLRRLAAAVNLAAQDVSNTLYGLARLAERGRAATVEGALSRQPAALRSLLMRMCSPACLQAAEPQAVANTLWSLAKLVEVGVVAVLEPAPAVLRDLLEHLCSAGCLQGANPQHVANALWALAKLEELEQAAVVPPALHVLTAAGAPLERRPATAALAQQPAALRILLERMCSPGCLEAAEPQAVSNTLWALAKLRPQSGHTAAWQGRHGDRDLARLLQQAAALGPDMSEQSVANTLWACGELGVCSKAAMGALSAAARLRQARMLPQELSNAALGAAKVAGPAAQFLVGRLLAEAAKQVKQQGGRGASACGASDLAALCWAAALAQLPAGRNAGSLPALRALCGELAARCQGGEQLAPEELQQLWQLCTWVSQCGGDLGSLLPAALQEQCRQAWQERQQQHHQQQQGSQPSSLEAEVQQALEDPRCGLEQPPLRGQACRLDGMWLLDFVATLGGGAEVAVQADGAVHFVRWLDGGAGQQQLRVSGDTAFRNAALRQRGHALVEVTAHEWAALSSHDKRVAWLAGQLKQAAGEPASAPKKSSAEPQTGKRASAGSSNPPKETGLAGAQSGSAAPARPKRSRPRSGTSEQQGGGGPSEQQGGSGSAAA